VFESRNATAGWSAHKQLLRTGFSYCNLLVLGSRYCLLFVHRINLNTDGCKMYNLRKDNIITNDYIQDQAEVHALFLQHPF